MNWWQLLLERVGIFGVTAAVIAFFAKKIIQLFFAKDLENFKTNLRMRAFKHEVRFSSLHEKMAGVIAELYEKLAKAHRAIGEYIKTSIPAGDLPEKDRGRNAVNAYNDFLNYYEEHAIYLDEKTCSKLDDFIKENQRVILSFQWKDANGPEFRIKNWTEVEKKFEDDVIALKKDLERDFRRKIGVTVDKF